MSLSLCLQLLLVAISMYNTVVSVKSLQGRHGLPFLNQVAGWMIFGVCLGPTRLMRACECCC